MRIVLDVNVLVSAILTPGGEAEAIRNQVEDRFVLLVSEYLLDELDRVLHYPRIRSAFSHLSDDDIARYLTSLRDRSDVVTVKSNVDACSDPDDNPILALAVDGRADCLVTRNLSHFPASYRQVQVLSPAGFHHLIRSGCESSPPDSNAPLDE